MRYVNEKTGDWVEFKPGFAKLRMAEVLRIVSTPEELAKWVQASEFDNGSGTRISITDGASLLTGLSFPQWDWLSDQLRTWARDDALRPEA